MTQAWLSIKRIVAEAMEAPPDERRALIEDRTGSDMSLRQEVESLIRAAEGAEGVLSPRLDACVGIGGPDLAALRGQRIGRYQLERLIAEGSTSAVYEATQANPARRVAVKVLRDALPLIDSSRRFDREAAALGRLNHPNIARIFEAGRHRSDAGVTLPFLAMEFVDGHPITEFVRKRGLERDTIVRMAARVASAVHAAHQQAIIHRDLKPANVLVGADGEPKVLDFGIAQFTDSDARTWRTTAGVLLGTPGYMSPEQAGGRLDEIDVRTDVWACGVLLYQMLTGRLPIDVRGVPLVEALKRIERDEPTGLAAVAPHLAGDLAVIVMTALAREKSGRYESAAALADDLERFLRNETIAARPPTTLYRFQKFARRNRVGLAIAGVFVALVFVSTGLLIKSNITTRQERDRAKNERDRAEAVSTLMRQLVAAGDPNYGDRNVKMVDVLRAAEGRIASSVGGRVDVEADVRSALGEMYFGLGEYERSQAALNRALELRAAHGMQNDVATLTDQNSLANTLRWLNKPDEARTLAERTRATAQHALGEGHIVSLTAAEVLAGCAHDVQDLPTAEFAYRKTSDACLKHLGADHRLTLVVQTNHGNVLTDQGKYAEAEAIYRQVLDARRRNQTERTLEGLTVQKNVASVMLEQGRGDEALRGLEQVCKDATEALGAGHDSTLRFLSSFTEALRRGGDADRALVIEGDILNRRVASLGWSHEYTLNDALGYTSALMRIKRFEDARAIAQRAADEAARSPDPNAVPALRIRLALASALSGLGKHTESRTAYDQVLPILRAKLGEDHQFVLIAGNNFGLACIEAGDGPAAVAALEPVLKKVLAQQFVSMEPVVRRNLGNALRVAMRYEDSESQLLKAWELSTARGEIENSLKTAAVLADLYRDSNQPVKASEWSARTAAK